MPAGSWRNGGNSAGRILFRLPDPLARLILLLAISWSAAVSWGYNLPHFTGNALDVYNF
ncbi:MAG: hypothetical protein IPL27_11045 [Lewinellaceae bacterium]|nr:hypothetical protein [Lewinellaceae bacterium]